MSSNSKEKGGLFLLISMQPFKLIKYKHGKKNMTFGNLRKKFFYNLCFLQNLKTSQYLFGISNLISIYCFYKEYLSRVSLEKENRSMAVYCSFNTMITLMESKHNGKNIRKFPRKKTSFITNPNCLLHSRRLSQCLKYTKPVTLFQSLVVLHRTLDILIYINSNYYFLNILNLRNAYLKKKNS